MIAATIQVVLWFMILLVATLFGFSLYLFGARSKEVRDKLLMNEYIDDYGKRWYSYFRDLEPFSDDLIPKNKHEMDAVEELFLSYLQNLSDRGILYKIKLFANEHLSGHYRQMLQSRNWSRRMNALYRIADFQLDQLLETCESLKQKRITEEEHFQLLKIKLLLQEDKFMESFVSMATEISDFQYKQLFFSLKPSMFTQLLFHFGKLHPACQYALIDSLGIKKDIDGLSFLEQRLDSEDAEIRIRSLKAINELGVRIDIDRYKPFVTSPVWEERLMAAQLLQRLSFEETASFFERMKDDPSWYVREEAKKAIAEYGQYANDPVSKPAKEESYPLERIEP